MTCSLSVRYQRGNHEMTWITSLVSYTKGRRHLVITHLVSYTKRIRHLVITPLISYTKGTHHLAIIPLNDVFP
jgi:hypothetical protein